MAEKQREGDIEIEMERQSKKKRKRERVNECAQSAYISIYIFRECVYNSALAVKIFGVAIVQF